jgi:hypothetical protein
MAKKELTVGTDVTRKETGQIGKIMNMYSGNYIVELSSGDTTRHETRIVSPAVMDTDYSVGKKSASFVVNADEEAAFQQQKDIWTKGIYNLMIKYIGATSPIPPSEECIGAIYTFAKDAANDIAVSRSGEVFTNAMQTFVDNSARSKTSYARQAADRAYQELLASVKGDPAAEQQVTAMYQKQMEALKEKEGEARQSASTVKPTDYADQGYMERVAQAIWIATDIKPRIEAMISNAATEAGTDPSAVMEQPVPPGEQELATIAKTNPEAAQKLSDRYNQQIEALQPVAIRMKQLLKSSEELKAMWSVLPQNTAARVIQNINKASTPAEILASITHFAVNTLTAPTTGTQTKHKRREPKMQQYERVHPYAVDQAYPEFANVSDVPEEKEMLAFRRRFLDAICSEDTAGAEKILAQMEQVKTEYQTAYSDLLQGADAPKPGEANPELNSARDEFAKAMIDVSRQTKEWEGQAKEQLQKAKPPEKKKKSEAAVTSGYGPGQPVKYKDLPGVHFIVSYDDNDARKLYLIAESDVNSHDRTELVVANIDEIQALRVYNIDIGDVVDAFGSVGRVTDASAKDLGYVYAELRGGQIVPIELAKTATPWHYAEPIEITRCATCDAPVSHGGEHNCPFIGLPMMGKPKGKPEMPTDAKKDEKTASIDLNAALESLDVAATFPAPAKGVEVYEDETNQIEIGSTVKKFGTMITGTVVGFKRNCHVVDWENGVTEPCWPQELVLVTIQEDAN